MLKFHIHSLNKNLLSVDYVRGIAPGTNNEQYEYLFIFYKRTFIG